MSWAKTRLTGCRQTAAEGELQAGAARELLDLAMRDLAPADRLVITLQEIEGRSVKEIAALMGISGVAVRVRALRARVKLKRALEKLKTDKT